MRTILCASLLFLAVSCFTGVESTPKIGKSELRHKNADKETSEQLLLADIMPEPFNSWKKGKRFLVTDGRISMIFAPGTSNPSFNVGDGIIFDNAREVTSPVGKAVDLTFYKPGVNVPLTYRINSPLDELNERMEVEIPFTVDPAIADTIRTRILGKTFYVSTPRWYDGNDNLVTRMKFIPVTITEVAPGNFDFPVRVTFLPDYDKLPKSETYSVMMSVGNGSRSTRNFDTLFSLSNPRLRYSSITDENWTAIIENRVLPGMTREEARLSLGSPKDVDRGHDYSSVYERWVYDGGVYLIFRDGVLESFRR